MQGCRHFDEILQNCMVCQVCGRMCSIISIIFLAFTPKLPIQTSLSVVPMCSVSWCTTQFQQNEHTPGAHVNFMDGDGLATLEDSPDAVKKH